MSGSVHQRSINPRLVLLFSLAAPGLGHFATRRFSRAFGFAFFTILFAALTWKFSSVDRSLIGRTAGGLFVWALSVPDAYKGALLRRCLSSTVAHG